MSFGSCFNSIDSTNMLSPAVVEYGAIGPPFSPLKMAMPAIGVQHLHTASY
jgi:hypothetical protein